MDLAEWVALIKVKQKWPASKGGPYKGKKGTPSGAKPLLLDEIQGALIVQKLQVAQNVFFHFFWLGFGIEFL